jgi:hypothetical protein
MSFRDGQVHPGAIAHDEGARGEHACGRRRAGPSDLVGKPRLWRIGGRRLHDAHATRPRSRSSGHHEYERRGEDVEGASCFQIHME